MALAVSSWAAQPASMPATARAAEKEIKVLAIGNSFSGNAISQLRRIVKSAGGKLVLGHASIGGCTIQKHIELARLHEKSPDDPNGRPYAAPPGAEGKASLKDWLTADKWQYVTIQQFSEHSWRPETYEPYTADLLAYIRKYAPQAKVLVHQTWAYRSDGPRLARWGISRRQMHERLQNAYGIIAKGYNLGVIPVGEAFEIVASDETFGYKAPGKADVEVVTAPALPVQANSLHTGYVWSKGADGKSVLRLDDGHANAAGSYLGGLVWFEYIYGLSAEEVSYTPPGLDAGFAAFLRKSAHKAVQQGMPLPATLPATAPSSAGD